MDYYSRKFSGLAYGVNYIRQSHVDFENNQDFLKKQYIADRQNIINKKSNESSIISTITSTIGGATAIPTFKKLVSIGKQLKNNVGNDIDENENFEYFENENTEPESQLEINPTEMTPDEIHSFRDPYESKSQFTDPERFEPEPEEPEIEEPAEPVEFQLPKGVGRIEAGENGQPDTYFDEEGYQMESPADVIDRNATELENNFDNLEETRPSESFVGRQFNKIMGNEKSVSNLSKFKEGQFEFSKSGGNQTEAEAEAPEEIPENQPYEIEIESVSRISRSEDAGSGVIEATPLTQSYTPSESNYSIQSFDQFQDQSQTERLVSGQFGGDSTIARLMNDNKNTTEQFSEHDDNISNFGDYETAGENIGETTGETVGETTAETVGETIGETTAETVGETVAETGAVTGLESAALVSDSVALSTVEIPGVDIATAVIGGIITAASIGTSIGLGIKNLIDNNNANKQINTGYKRQIQPPQQLSYLGAEAENYLNH